MVLKNKTTAITFDDAKLKNVLKHLYVANKGLKLGILEGATTPDGNVSIAEYAFYNEFGTPKAKHPIPARPFMRNTVANKSDEWAKILSNAIYGNSTQSNIVAKALGIVGTKGRSDIQQTIEAGGFIANAESTKKRKVISKKEGTYKKELKVTGDMFNAISFEVTDSKGNSL